MLLEIIQSRTKKTKNYFWKTMKTWFTTISQLFSSTGRALLILVVTDDIYFIFARDEKQLRKTEIAFLVLKVHLNVNLCSSAGIKYEKVPAGRVFPKCQITGKFLPAKFRNSWLWIIPVFFFTSVLSHIECFTYKSIACCVLTTFKPTLFSQ